MASWEWRNDDFKFVPFKPKENEVMEVAWAKSEPSLLMKMGAHAYDVDLLGMTQTNKKTGKERLLRRIGPKGEVTARGPAWEWEVHHGKWQPYDTKTSDEIEVSYLRNDLTHKIHLATGAHDEVEILIHFGHMHQQSGATEGVRRIRRVIKFRDDTAEKKVAKAVPEMPEVPAPSPSSRKRSRSADKEQPPPPPAKRGDPAEALGKSALPAGTWGQKDTMLFLPQPISPVAAHFASEGNGLRVAAFDMDDTLVMPADGKATFPKGRNDWKWLHNVEHKLKELYSAGYFLLIVSNQGGISMNKLFDAGKASHIKGKIDDLSAALGVPLSAVLAAAEDRYRKPGTAMWDFFVDKMLPAGVQVDMTNSFYCGDAAGRQILTMAGRKKDFSCSDRKFAYNVGLPFKTPEALFATAVEAKYEWDGLGPEELKALPKEFPSLDFPSAGTNELVVFVGYPGSGKSSLYRRIFAPRGYVHINRDTLKTPEACCKAADLALAAGKSVVVDNTSPAAADRKLYTTIAKKHHASCRCVVMDVPEKLANHLNIMRDKLGISDRVSSIAYRVFKGKYEEPTLSEGFTSIHKVPLVPSFDGLPAEAKKFFHQLS